MTMSLVGPGLTTTSYKKRKQTNRTKVQQSIFENQHRDHNKRMKQSGAHDQMMSLAEYDLYVRGNYKPEKKKFKELVPSAVFQRDTKQYPSKGTGIGVASKKESPKSKNLSDLNLACLENFDLILLKSFFFIAIFFFKLIKMVTTSLSSPSSY